MGPVREGPRVSGTHLPRTASWSQGKREGLREEERFPDRVPFDLGHRSLPRTRVRLTPDTRYGGTEGS